MSKSKQQETAVEQIEVALGELNDQPQPETYIKFGEAAKLLNVRFQQVYQRAVVRGKMNWHETEQGAKVVGMSSVNEWAAIRKQLGKSAE